MKPDRRDPPSANTFSASDAAAMLLIKNEKFPHQQAIGLYVLLVWARFPELAPSLDAYFAQAALRLASRRCLSGNTRGIEPGCSLLRHNLELQAFTNSLPAGGDLSIAAGALAPWQLDQLRTQPTTIFRRQSLLATYLITSIWSRPELLQKKSAQLAFERGIAGVGQEIWGKRRGAEEHGPVKASFDQIWDADEALLVRHLLGFDGLPEQPAVSDAVVDAENALLDADLDDSVGAWSLDKLLMSPTVFADFFEKPLDKGIAIEARRRLHRYRALVDKLRDCEEAKFVQKRWGGALHRSDLWEPSQTKAAADCFKRYRFSREQEAIATATIKGRRTSSTQRVDARGRDGARNRRR